MPLDLGAGRRGVDMGPSAIRLAGLHDRLRALSYAVIDRGDIAVPIPETKRPGDARKRYVREIARACHKVFQTARDSLDDGALPLVLGGDHSLAPDPSRPRLSSPAESAAPSASSGWTPTAT